VQASPVVGPANAPAAIRPPARKHHRKAHRKSRWLKAISFSRLDSTAYCGSQGVSRPSRYHHTAEDGVVALPQGTPLGGWYQIRSGPLRGKIVQAVDYIGSGSQFDIWLDSCSRANNWYGRQSIKVAQVSPYQAVADITRQHKRH
jgi:hypothetical protein